MTYNELWQAVLGEIELSLSKASFVTWFKNTSIEKIENSELVINVPNIFAKEWLEKKYKDAILQSIKRLRPEVVRFICVIGTKEEPVKKSIDSINVKASANTTVVDLKPSSSNSTATKHNKFSINRATPAFSTGYPQANLNKKYSFNNYVIGSNNELAFAACKAVAEAPGTNYNPLFIYGGVGLGKTHLLQSTGNYILEHQPHFKIRYTSMERFSNELIEAIQTQKAKEFKNNYIKTDVLIMDDVQFLSGKEKMQEEFFHVFESLYQLGKQVILSSDRPPKSIATLEDRLRSRFEGGMMADISKPDLETRIAIIKRKLNEKGFALADEIVQYLAQNISHNVRELEGALTKIIVTCQLKNQPPTLKDVMNITRDIISVNQQRELTPKKIIDSVAEFYNVKSEEISGRCRKKTIVKPRQVAIYLIRRELNMSFPEIGQLIGGRDHSTAIHACDKIGKELQTNNILQENLKFIEDKLSQY